MNDERVAFIESLSLLVRGNLSIIDAVASLRAESRNKKFAKTLEKIEEELKSGSNLSSALASVSFLPEDTIGLISLGEQTGRLYDQLAIIVQNQRKSAAFRAQIQNALMYPAFVLTLMVIVGTVMVWYVFPKFILVFSQVGGKLPLPTLIIIGVGKFFSSYGIIAVPLFFAALTIILYLLFIYPSTRLAGDKLILALPVTHTLFRTIELARMSYALSSQIQSGISLPESLASLQESTRLIPYRRLYAGISDRVMDGEPLSKSMEEEDPTHTYLPLHIVRLVGAAERSGMLGNTFLELSEMYESKASSVAGNFSALLEPAITVIIGLIVGLVAFGVLSPIYSLLGRIS